MKTQAFLHLNVFPKRDKTRKCYIWDRDREQQGSKICCHKELHFYLCQTHEYSNSSLERESINTVSWSSAPLSSMPTCPFPDWLSPSHCPTGNTISTCPQRDAPPSPKLAPLLFLLFKDQCQHPPGCKEMWSGRKSTGTVSRASIWWWDSRCFLFHSLSYISQILLHYL